MSTLTIIDKKVLEGYFQMNEGHVLDFTIPSLKETIKDLCGEDIYTSKYEELGTSKAKRLRSFFSKASADHQGENTRGVLSDQGL